MPYITQDELIQMIAEEAGSPLKIQAVGRLMISMLGMFVPEVKESVEMLVEFAKPFVKV